MRIGIDVGGTFTDFFIFDEESGEFITEKILSTPHNPDHALLNGLERIHPETPPYIIHGSTVATNALLERKGARTALISTQGFRDVIVIGRQIRRDLYDFFIHRPRPVVQDKGRLEIKERIDHYGRVITPLDEDELPILIDKLRNLDVESVAVCLLFSFVNPAHEQMITQSLRQAGFTVSASCEVLPEFREYERTSTTVINAYVSPIIDRYLGGLEERLEVADFHIMQSNGGSIRAAEARAGAVRSILSGPAGGVVGAFNVAQTAGFEQIISFDMGGTSTDVSLCDGAIRVTNEAEIDGFPIRVPVIDIHTVGSGGGSIAYIDAGGALRVGPKSAGADPGPVCYGRGGVEPTVTDANLLIGRLAPDHFLGGRMGLDVQAAEKTLDLLARNVGLTPWLDLTPAQTVALGVIKVVNARMERALRVISVERGFDPRDFTLVSFGGAGGLHAVDLARALGIPYVLVPPCASTLSAFGMLTAEVIKDYVQTVMMPGDTPFGELERLLSQLAERGLQEVQREGVSEDRINIHRELDMRYVGQGYELTLPLSPDFIRVFHDLHQKTYGHSAPESPVEIVNIRLRAIGDVSRPTLPSSPLGVDDPSEAFIGRRAFVHEDGRITDEPFYQGEHLQPGQIIAGPAMIVFKDTTVYLPEGSRANVDEYSNLVIEVRSET